MWQIKRLRLTLVVFAIALVGSAMAKAQLSEGLVFLMNFDEGSGDVVHDLSDNGNHGKIIGTPRWRSDGSGGALHLDGSTYISVPNADPISELTEPMTAGVWINPNVLDSWHSIVEIDGLAGWKLGLFGSSVVWTTYNVMDFINQAPIQPGEWTHIAATWDGSQAVIYINGVPSAPISGGGLIDVKNEPSLDIGYRRTSGESFYIGFIDDLFIYNRVLGQQEISELMLAHTRPSTVYAGTEPSLALYLPLDEGQGSTVKDFSHNGNNGILIDSPQWVNGRPGKALEFSAGSRVHIPAYGSLHSNIFRYAFTVTAWVKPTLTGDVWQLIWRSVDQADVPQDSLLVNTSGRLSWRGRVGGQWGVRCETADGAVNAYEWTHIAVVGDRLNFRIYINGNEAAISPFVEQDGGIKDFYLGSDGVFLSETYSGTIDEIRVFTRALTADEIEAAVQLRELSITSAFASPGNETTVHLSITNAMGVAGGDVLIKYDASLVAIGEIKSSSMISDMNIMANTNTPGEIMLGMIRGEGLDPGFTNLVDIELVISNDAQLGTETTLRLDSARIYDENGFVVPVDLVDGVLKVEQPGVRGDVNNDGEILSNDAILALRIATKLMVPTDYQRWAADMNGDGEIGSNDAILILRKAIGLAAPSLAATVSITTSLTVTLSEVSGTLGETVTLPLKVDNVMGLAGGDICISYDQVMLHAIDISSDCGAFMASNAAEPGIVRIAFAGIHGLRSNTIANVKFQILADSTSQPMLQTAKLYRNDAFPINVTEMYGRSTVPIFPKHSKLLQNYPNPFNPETWMPYQLNEASNVAITIYDVTGKVTRNLDLGYKSAGTYLTQSTAAYWDGRNETGETMASGVYFAVLRAGEYQQTRRMVLLK